jgi:hypothetical protein
MNMALILALIAVAICLFVIVKVATQSKAHRKKGDNGADGSSSDNGADCGPGDAGGCDGGGGGGD